MIPSIHVFKALADETRFKLLTLLLSHDLCVGALARHLGTSEAAVSQHLKQLRAAGLVKGEKRGYWTHYSVEKEMLDRVAETLRELTNLPQCSEGIRIKTNSRRKIDCHKEDKKMCDCNCNCQYPGKLEGKPEECTPEQIKECHGDQEHPCEGEKK